SSVAVLRKVSDEQPRPIKALCPETPDWLIEIVKKLQAKDPDDRYQSAGMVADLLARHLAELQQPARPSAAKPAGSTEVPRSKTRIGAGRWMALISILAASALAVVALILAAQAWPGMHPKADAPSARPEMGGPESLVGDRAHSPSPANVKRALALHEKA